MRMRFADADPNDSGRTFWRKRADADDREKKSTKLDGTEFFAQPKIECFRNVTEETERQMHLIAFGPAHAADRWIKTCEQLARGLWQVDCNKETLGHRYQTSSSNKLRASAQPAFANFGAAGAERQRIASRRPTLN